MIEFSPNLVPNGLIIYQSIYKLPAFVQIMVWRRPGDKPSSETIIFSLLTHICVTQPRWVKTYIHIQLWPPVGIYVVAMHSRCQYGILGVIKRVTNVFDVTKLAEHSPGNGWQLTAIKKFTGTGSCYGNGKIPRSDDMCAAVLLISKFFMWKEHNKIEAKNQIIWYLNALIFNQQKHVLLGKPICQCKPLVARVVWSSSVVSVMHAYSEMCIRVQVFVWCWFLFRRPLWMPQFQAPIGNCLKLINHPCQCFASGKSLLGAHSFRIRLIQQ